VRHETVLWPGLFCSKPFLNHKRWKLGQGHFDSGQTVLWKRIHQLLEPFTGPTIWPVPAGLAVGGALLAVVFLSQPPVKPVSDAQPAAKSFEGLPEKAAPAGPRSSQTLLLPPRPEAADVTRRIENGLPRKDPAPTPVAAAPVAKTQVVERRAVNKGAVNPGAAKSVSVVLSRPPVQGRQRRPRIAIVIDDMGFDRANSARALRLPPQVTVAYLPFAPDVATQVRRARLKGHPVMLHLPMEAPDHGGKPGANVLSVTSGPEKLRRQLREILGRFGGYTGVNNHMGSKFTRDRARMNIVISELKKRGLFFLDSRTSGSSVGAAVAADAGIAHATRDVFLDHEPDPKKIRARIAETERIARQTGQAIAIGHPRTATMKALAPWLSGLKARGFDLVRLDTLLKRPGPKILAQVQTAE
jgi:polysaccharide deacetylase 2 family uncharacterized protein YibQ